MKSVTKRCLPFLWLYSILFIPEFIPLNSVVCQSTGTIMGIVTDHETHSPLTLINVVLKGTTFGSSTNDSGMYIIPNVQLGSHTLIISAVGYETIEDTVQVHPNTTVKKDFAMREQSVQMSEVLVYGASLRQERITEAPSAISVVGTGDIERQSSCGQLPKLLESEPGIDVAQNGLFDFNINTRGFNSSLNRRMLILLDGRDLGTAFLGATEWNGLSTPLEDLGRIEIVRGPGSALYGANAYNGVINITSMIPRFSPGTKVIAGIGELNMYRGDIRHAGVIGQWSYRVNFGAISGKSFSRMRTGKRFEYSIDPFEQILIDEVVDLDLAPIRTMYGSARLDYEYKNGGFTTIEGGLAQVENEVIVTGIGRVQIHKAQRPWGRLHYSGHGFNVLLWSNIRLNKEPERSLSTGLHLIQDASITHGEVQYSFSAFENKLFLVGGISHRLVNIDTKGTLMRSKRTDNLSGIFGQVEYKIVEELKSVVAARYDRSTLYEGFLSPKAALVWSPSREHTFRATFNRAFQSPNYSELFLFIKHPTKALAYLGNDELRVEKITGYELGYKGVYYDKLFLSVDAYYNEMKDFITDLGPGLNPKYPASVPFPDDPPSMPSRSIWSYSNAGKVNESGFELAANYYLSNNWLFDINFSYFGFKIIEGHPNDPNNAFLAPNAPRHKINGGITFTQPEHYSVGIKVKYVPTYYWAAGIYYGDILAYTLVDFNGTYNYSKVLSFAINASNLFDREHWEIFGGSILGRRAVATVIISL